MKVENDNKEILDHFSKIKSNINTIDNNFVEVEKVIKTLKAQESKDKKVDEALKTLETSGVDSDVSKNSKMIAELQKSEKNLKTE